MAKLDFREVKSKAAEYAKATHVWRPAQIEEVFLGGSDLGTSGVAMSEDEWAQSVDALKELVRRTSERILEQASLYNAAKHGLVGVPGEVAKWSMSSEGGPSLDVAEGRGVTYLLREYPSKAWAAQTDIVDIESDFLIVQLVAIAVHNLWTAARRRYIARKGHLYSLHPQLVDEAFLVGVAGKRNVARGMRVALHRKADRTAPWGKGLEPARYRLNMVRVDKDVAKQLSSNDDRYQVEARELPLRPADTSPFTGGNRTLFPFTPGWASVV
ncbi:hypothetical protein [Krasilnikoviella flava]|uniref:hypothetical protein n=1 Tax=Krasilnikoviella flava TaxID=526729 RepID=UPI00111C878D|nr:hypothetical protein [Krasilnikoviella flava]